MIKQLFTLLSLFHLFTITIQAQSTKLDVYKVFEQKCASCHDHASPQSGLDLEGAGSTIAARANDVYDNIVNANPANTYAASKGYKYIEPGRPDKSFLFRKINNDLEETIALHESEMDAMPPSDMPQLTNEEKELIRQWIIFGAPADGDIVDKQLISDFYNVNGLKSFPDGAPPAPAASEGFQIKMGPFFLKPSGNPEDELEFYQKYKLDLPADVDVTRLDIKISNYSHHFILYSFGSEFASDFVGPGLRMDPFHFDINLIAAVQEQTDLRLPEGTAFIWENDLTLDLNAHYINYSAMNTYQAEAYVNVYTQPKGTAAQEMKTELLIKNNIPIPNSGDEVIHTQSVFSNDFDEAVYLWGMMGHTHKYGRDYKVYERLPGNEKGALIYDASCPQGVPNCVSPLFDYRHIPIRYFEPLRALELDPSNGIIHEAKWVNEGPTSVNFGPTSDDEMMVMVIMFTEGIEGITAIEEELEKLEGITISPNPMVDKTTIELPIDIGTIDFILYDLLGRVVRYTPDISERVFELNRDGLNTGMYMYHITDDQNRVLTGKLMVR